MRLTAFRSAHWLIFASLLAASGLRLLVACDFGAPSFFNLGLKYCPAPTVVSALRDADDIRRELQSQIHDNEVRLAEAPNCAPPTLVPLSNPQPRALRVPGKLGDLKGCWVSDRSDIVLHDTITNEPTGQAKFCYCFGERGQGVIRLKKAGAPDCKGPISVHLDDDRLQIDQPYIQCPDVGYVHHTVTCKTHENGRTTCTRVSRDVPNPLSQEDGFHRAEPSECD